MRKLGNICMALGLLMVLGAISLWLWNRAEDEKAGSQAAAIVEKLQEKQAEYTGLTGAEVIGQLSGVPDPYDPAMTEVEMDGYGYIGYLKLPNMEELLPVMTDWSYPQLQIAPCRFYGSTKTGDLVIMAHNFPKHFGKLEQLKQGNVIYFLDMDDVVWKYEVMALEILGPNDVEDMTAGEFDLTLFTCTFGGKSRVTVRCDRIVE